MPQPFEYHHTMMNIKDPSNKMKSILKPVYGIRLNGKFT